METVQPQSQEHFKDFCWRNHVDQAKMRTFLFDMLDFIYEEYEPNSVDRAEVIGQELGRIGLYQ